MNNIARIRYLRGQAFPEYIVGVLMLIAAFFTPLPGQEGKTATTVLMDAFQKNYMGYEYVLSQPAED